jgi:hypothetical protein
MLVESRIAVTRTPTIRRGVSLFDFNSILSVNELQIQLLILIVELDMAKIRRKKNDSHPHHTQKLKILNLKTKKSNLFYFLL